MRTASIRARGGSTRRTCRPDLSRSRRRAMADRSNWPGWLASAGMRAGAVPSGRRHVAASGARTVAYPPQRTATGPMPVMISRSGRCPWRTSRWRPSSVSLSAWTLSDAATSASTACANSARPAVAQDLGQRARKSSWMGELENISVGHGVSLLRWRSGGLKHPHDTPYVGRCIYMTQRGQYASTG
jgi:hypothetical protein